MQILGGCQGRRTGVGVGVTTVSNSLILGGWVTKVLKNSDKNGGGGGVEGWVTTIFRLFRPTVPDKKCPLSCLFLYTFAYLLKKLHVGQFFVFVFAKFRNS